MYGRKLPDGWRRRRLIARPVTERGLIRIQSSRSPGAHGSGPCVASRRRERSSTRSTSPLISTLQPVLRSSAIASASNVTGCPTASVPSDDALSVLNTMVRSSTAWFTGNTTGRPPRTNPTRPTGSAATSRQHVSTPRPLTHTMSGAAPPAGRHCRHITGHVSIIPRRHRRAPGANGASCEGPRSHRDVRPYRVTGLRMDRESGRREHDHGPDRRDAHSDGPAASSSTNRCSATPRRSPRPSLTAYRTRFHVEVCNINDAASDLGRIDLLVVGAPTHAFGMSRRGDPPHSRTEAGAAGRRPRHRCSRVARRPTAGGSGDDGGRIRHPDQVGPRLGRSGDAATHAAPRLPHARSRR